MSASAEAFLARILSRWATVKEKSTVSAPEKNAESRNSAGNANSIAMRRPYAPSWRRAKRFTVMGAPISLATDARYCSTVCSPSAT